MDADWQRDPRYLPSLHSPLDEVAPGFFLGGIEGRAHVAAHKITLVVALLTEPEYATVAPLPPGVHEVRLYLADTERADPLYVARVLDRGVAALQEAKAREQRVLVHCAAGVSRSSTLVLDYWCTLDPALTPADALRRLEQHRYCVCPNPRFQYVLLERHAARREARDAPH